VSLATRCTECGTVFRVVQDQLKVSEGWVRCGRCSAVFNALENLCNVDGDEAPAAGLLRREADAAHDHRPAAAEAMFAEVEADPHAAYGEPSRDNPHAAQIDPYGQADPATARPAEARGGLEVDEAHDAAFAPTHGPDSLAPMPVDDDSAIVTFSSESPADPPPAPPPPAPVPEPAPQFVRAANRDAFWRRPRMQAAVIVATVLLGLLLAGQLARANRDLLAAHVPATLPALTALCQATACRVQPLRRIDRLSVDSSGLARIEGAALYRLSVVLHNRAETALQSPALDLSLTDAAGKLVARRVLQPAELGLGPVLEAGQELPLQTTLSTGDKRVTGYTVELFYP